MKKTVKGFAVIVMLCLVLGLLCSCTETEKSKYEGAQSLLSQGKYAEAAEKFEALGGYEESSKLTIYCKAAEAGERGDYETALNGFMTLGEYKDSPLMLSYYNNRMYEDGNWHNKLYAASLYDQNKLFRDSAARAESCRKSVYNEAVALQQAGKYEEAITEFEALNGYGDSATQITETKYLKAKYLTTKGDYAGAAAIFIGIKGYKDVDSLLENDDNLAAAVRYSVGNYVTFGHYPQTSAGTDSTAIEWLVVARDENKALLLSRYGLDVQPYNTQNTNITWEKCTLRTWLNGTFLNKAFTAQEQGGILQTNVDNSKSQCYSRWSTSGGNNTQDRIFLLSYAEANKYLGVEHWKVTGAENNTKSRVAPTAYAVKQMAYTSSSNKTAEGMAAGVWWLRSPGYDQEDAAFVNHYGALYLIDVDHDSVCVRPALWINLESDIF